MPDFGIGETFAAILSSLAAAAPEVGGAAALGGGLAAGADLGGALLIPEVVASAAAPAIAAGGLTAGELAGGIGALGAAGLGAGELAGGAGGFGAAGADTGATFGDSLTPATTGGLGGGVEAGAFDAPLIDVGGAATSLINAPAGFSPPAAAPGVTGSGPLAASPQNTLAGIGGAPSGAPAAPAPVIGGAPVSPDLTAGALGGNPGADVFSGITSSSPATQTAGQIGADAGAAFDTLTPATEGVGGAVEQGGFGAPSTWAQIKGAISPITSPIGDAIDSAGSLVSSPVGKLAGAAISGAGLLKSLSTPAQIPGMAQQGSIAAGAAQQGTLLSSYLTNGTLPPGVQSSIDSATQSAITAIKARYAGMGVPPNSSMELQEINSAKQNAVTQGVNIADQLLAAGGNLTNLSAQVYASLVNENQTLNNGVNTAIGNLANALSGGTKITVNGTQATT